MKTKLPLFLALLLLTQCSKCKDDVTPAEQLPPATQTGANTFGCLVNGQAWTSETSTGHGSFVFQYEPGINTPLGANFNMSLQDAEGGREIHIAAGLVSQVRAYSLSLPTTEGSAGYFNLDSPYSCNEFLHFEVPYLKGTLTFTRVDEQAGVAAGTFEFTIAKPGCDTIRVTQGRFDHKI